MDLFLLDLCLQWSPDKEGKVLEKEGGGHRKVQASRCKRKALKETNHHCHHPHHLHHACLPVFPVCPTVHALFPQLLLPARSEHDDCDDGHHRNYDDGHHHIQEGNLQLFTSIIESCPRGSTNLFSRKAIRRKTE